MSRGPRRDREPPEPVERATGAFLFDDYLAADGDEADADADPWPDGLGSRPSEPGRLGDTGAA